jgi:hypothetical protein
MPFSCEFLTALAAPADILGNPTQQDQQHPDAGNSNTRTDQPQTHYPDQGIVEGESN